jgi:tetratricopeptide (TPR) repeat protein
MSRLLNPYIVGGSLSDSSGAGFYGRERVFAFVQRSLNVARRVPIVIYGQRRIGKSSVLRQLPRFAPDGSVCVFYDLQGKSRLGLDGILYGLARETAHACGLPRPTRPDATEESFTTWLDHAMEALGAPEKLVLLFDEFDVVDDDSAPASQFLSYLAKLVESHPSVAYVLVVGRKTSHLSEHFVESILRTSVQDRLGRFGRDTSDRLATELGKGTLRFESGALDMLFTQAAGHPYCTQLLCHVIWNRLVPGAMAKPVPVRAKDVEAAIPEALELGTNGLNWIYDGLDVPSHRQFLAALAEQLDGHGCKYVSLEEIEKRLFGSGMLVDAAQLRTAPGMLADWDVIVDDPSGFRFTVPLIGRWIRTNRPMSELEHEAKLINPRAWRYYELAAHNQETEDFDEAIDNYNKAISANPALIEAHLGLATSYRGRDGAGDLDLAIESYERALDLDSKAPRKALLEALVESLESSDDDARLQVRRFERIGELDPGGSQHTRAARHLRKMATKRLPIGARLNEAELMFTALDDQDGLAATGQRMSEYQRYERLGKIGAVLFFSCIALAFVPYDDWLSVKPAVSNWIRAGFAISVGPSIWLGIAAEDENLSPRWFVATTGIVGISVLVHWWLGSLLVTGFGSFFLTAIVIGILTPSTGSQFKAKRPTAQKENAVRRLMRNAGNMLIRYADRSSGSKDPPRGGRHD